MNKWLRRGLIGLGIVAGAGVVAKAMVNWQLRAQLEQLEAGIHNAPAGATDNQPSYMPAANSSTRRPTAAERVLINTVSRAEWHTGDPHFMFGTDADGVYVIANDGDGYKVRLTATDDTFVPTFWTGGELTDAMKTPGIRFYDFRDFARAALANIIGPQAATDNSAKPSDS